MEDYNAEMASSCDPRLRSVSQVTEQLRARKMCPSHSRFCDLCTERNAAVRQEDHRVSESRLKPPQRVIGQ